MSNDKCIAKTIALLLAALLALTPLSACGGRTGDAAGPANLPAEGRPDQSSGEADLTGVSEDGSEGAEDQTGDAMENNDHEQPSVSCVLLIEAGEQRFYANFEDNPSAQALIEKLNAEAITLKLHDYGSFEKVGPLPWELPRSDERITTKPGDVILYQGDQLTIYYDENTWTFTRLAQIADATKDKLLEAFGSGDVTVKLSLEWSE